MEPLSYLIDPNSSLETNQTAATAAIPIMLITAAELGQWLGAQDANTRAWVESTGFRAEPHSVLRIPGPDGAIARVLCGVGKDRDMWSLSTAAAKLKQGVFRIDAELEPALATRLSIGWVLGTYRFRRYKSKSDDALASLVWPETADRDAVRRTVVAIFQVRDLVNTPANDLGPGELAQAAAAMGKGFGAEIRVIEGEELVAQNYPAIYAVGKGSARPPRLIDMRWRPEDSDKKHLSRLTIVGKGVVFDSGGLDIKPVNGMKLMKKDMGGAAHALALARMVMMAELPVQLRVLVPAVENSISGNAFRPLDVIGTRKGLTVEVGNTDAEGRLVLCDALAEACTEKPDLLIDFATLTGAARVALGTDLAAMFCNDDALATELLACSLDQDDPMWRLPLYQPYAKSLASKVADTNNVADSGYGGAIVAALFLEKFVTPKIPWLHFDVFAWNLGSRPGRPSGGEAFALRAVFELLRRRFAV